MSWFRFYLVDVFEVLVLFSCFYWILRQLRGKKVFWMLTSLAAVLSLLYFSSWLLDLEHFEYFLTQILHYLPLILLVLFQSELRQMLTHLMDRWGRADARADAEEIIVNAVERLAKTRTGAIIAVEQKVALADLVTNPVPLDAKLSESLLLTIFYQGTALHDGAVVISKGRVAFAAAWLNLSRNRKLPMVFGSRHRAALGLSEECDAAVIVVSEETGHISLAYRSVLMQELSPVQLQELLELIKSASRAEVLEAYRRISRENDAPPVIAETENRRNLRRRQRLAATRFWPLGNNPFRRR